METKEYVVSLNRGVDYDTFWAEMENPTNGLTFVPDRRVEIINERPISLRQCHYALTDEETKILRSDPRVYCVEIPPSKRKDIKLVRNASQEGNFEKVLGPIGNYQNWGLLRCISETNNFGNSFTAPGSYDFVLDGSNVDVVIIDSGLMAEHPEFTSYKDSSPRSKIIDWYVESGLAEIGPVNLKTTLYSSVSPNSYINFEKAISAFWDYSFTTLGGSLVIGSIANPDLTRVDPASNAIYAGAEDSNKSFRIRFEGRSSAQFPVEVQDLVWECRFVDDNMIEILILRHDNPIIADWRINLSELSEPINSTKSIELNMFKDERLIEGAVSRSCVLSSSDAGLTWNVYGDDDTDYHLEPGLNGTWNIVEGVATEKGVAALSNIDNGSAANDGAFGFNTPFDFYCGISYQNPRTVGDDAEGHGTHVAGIATGKTFGWAKNANLYSIKVAGLEGVFDAGSGLPVEDIFDLVVGWHNNKLINPETGVKNPTVVNMSWGYALNYANITGGNYRGTPWVDTEINPAYGMTPYDEFPFHPIRVGTVDAGVQELIDAGIHVVIAAGNQAHKIDIVSGLDYNNYYTRSDSIEGYSAGDPIYYHRGSSPYDDQALIVGSTEFVPYNATTDRRANFSNHGPGVDIYAPGVFIISAMSWINIYNNVNIVAPYYPNPGNNFIPGFEGEGVFKQGFLTGTSMAAPQVAGVVGLMLQLHPEASVTQIKDFILNNATTNLYEGSNTDPYTDEYSLQGGIPRHLYHKFGVSKSFRLRFGGE